MSYWLENIYLAPKHRTKNKEKVKTQSEKEREIDYFGKAPKISRGDRIKIDKHSNLRLARISLIRLVYFVIFFEEF